MSAKKDDWEHDEVVNEGIALPENYVEFTREETAEHTAELRDRVTKQLQPRSTEDLAIEAKLRAEIFKKLGILEEVQALDEHMRRSSMEEA